MRGIKSVGSYHDLEEYFRLERDIMEPTLSMLGEINEQEPSLEKPK